MMELLAGPLGPLLIFLLRVADVSLGTVRLVLITRGARLPAAFLGVVEALIWITAVGSVILNLTSPWHVLGYACGFGAGTWVGLWLDEVVSTVVKRQMVPRVIQAIEAQDADAFITVYDARVRRGWFPQALRK